MNVAAFSEKRQEQKCLIFNENNNNMSCIHLEKNINMLLVFVVARLSNSNQTDNIFGIA
jgi:hypothetical protein